MAKIRIPWAARASDFNQPGLHTRMHRGYMLFFEFLRMSPSYELARKARQEGLSEAEMTKLPSDFDQVLATFDLLGDVQRVLFRQWWLKRGLKAFGNPFSRPKVHSIQLLPTNKAVGLDQCHEAMDHYLSDIRHEEGLNPALLVSLPLGRRKSEVLKQISKLLDQYAEADTSALAKPPLAFVSQRMHVMKLVNNLSVILFRAAKPTWELWRLGAYAQLSKTYSPLLDPKGPRKVTDLNHRTERDLMAKITYRTLKKAEAIAENAARGHFPSDAPVEQCYFDYPSIAKRNQLKNQWERTERARLLELQKARLAAQAAMPSEH